MTYDEAMKQICNLFAAAWLTPEKTYWLCLLNRQIVYYPRKELPDGAIKIFEFSHKMAKDGLTDVEWTKLETFIKKLVKAGLI